MSQPLAVVIRFSGDADELVERFERARRLWIEAQGDEYECPVFYAVCKTDQGIAIVSGWESAITHRAFGQGLHRHIDAAGLPTPANVERMPIEKLGWTYDTGEDHPS